MTSDDGSNSDESIIYTGKFLSITDAARQSLTSQIDDLTLHYTNEVATLTDENTSLKAEIESLKAELAQNNLIIDTLRASNESLSNELAELNKTLSSSQIEKKLQESKTAQSLANKQKNDRNRRSTSFDRISAFKADKVTTRINADRQQKYI